MMSAANSCLQYKTLEIVEARIIMGESFSSCVWCRILSWLEGGDGCGFEGFWIELQGMIHVDEAKQVTRLWY